MPLPLAPSPYSPMTPYTPTASLWSSNPDKVKVSREKSLRKRLLKIVSRSSTASSASTLVEEQIEEEENDVSCGSSLLESPAIISPPTWRNTGGSQSKPDVQDIARLRQVWTDSKCGPPVIHRTRPGSFSNLMRFPSSSVKSSPTSSNDTELSPSSSSTRSKMPIALTPRSSSSSSPIKRHERRSSTQTSISTLTESSTVIRQPSSARTGSMLSPVATNASLTKTNSNQNYSNPFFSRRNTQGLFTKSFDTDQPEERLANAWNVYVDFAINSKSQDAYIYAQTRQQAWRSFCCRNYRRGQIESLTFDIWYSMGLRFVFGGRNLLTPTGEFALSGKDSTTLLVIQEMETDPNSWQLALDFPNTQVSSVYQSSDEQNGIKYKFASGSGPVNQQLYSTKSLDKLSMFADNYFDVISARGLWYMVKSDDMPLVLEELKRVLKPGGCLELATVDIVPANTSEKAWKEIAVKVEDSGYAVSPSNSIVNSLFNTGFNDICRSWLGLPQGWGSTPQMIALTGFINDYLWRLYIDYWLRPTDKPILAELYSQEADEIASKEGTLTRILLTSCSKPSIK